MGNMSYCRFENTYNDLQECYNTLQNAGSIESVENDSNEYEKEYIKKLVELCKDIADEFLEDND